MIEALWRNKGRAVDVFDKRSSQHEASVQMSTMYRGTLGATGEIAGEWSEGPNHLPLTFKHVVPEAKKP